jgi:hypothetical protein
MSKLISSQLPPQEFSTDVDNILVDKSRKDHSSLESVINGLYDHAAQHTIIKKCRIIVIIS